jgi:hypothetical protein
VFSVHTVEAIVTTMNDLARINDAEEQRWLHTDNLQAYLCRGRKQGYMNSARLLDEMLQVEIRHEAEDH